MSAASRRAASICILALAAALLPAPGAARDDPDAPRARTPAWESPRPAARSEEDNGFSITLVSPREDYLLGRRSVVVEPTVPPGDSVLQVDFFVNGRLVRGAAAPPFSFEFDFGEEIRRRTIVVRARTRGGRRARVSFISRSNDLSPTSARPLEVVPVFVRDRRGRPVRGLSLSDFTLLEDGRRQRIVHFDDRPGPASVAFVLDAAAPGEAPRRTLLRGAEAVGRSLPPYHALTLLDTWAVEPPATGDESGDGTTLRFSYHRSVFTEDLKTAHSRSAPQSGPRPLADVLRAAAEALEERPGHRVLLVLAAPPPRPAAGDDDGPPAGEGPPPTAEPAPRAGGDAAPSGGSMAAALEELRRTRATVFAVVLGGPREAEPLAGLGAIARQSGGEILYASEIGTEESWARVAEALLHHYRVCYLPEDAARPGWRSIELRVDRPGLEVRAREGYEGGPDGRASRDPD
ncbi:MAG: hypothetical protein ACE5JH_08225 [Acidobacteriota bacterium]